MKTQNKIYTNKKTNFIEVIILQWKLYSKHMNMRYSNSPLLFLTRLLYFSSLYLLNPKRARIFLSCVMWLRHIDNISDGDYPFNGQLGEYLQSKEKLIEQEIEKLNDWQINHEEDILITDALRKAYVQNIKIKETLRQMLLINKKEYLRRKHSIVDENQILVNDAIVSDKAILLGAIPVMFEMVKGFRYMSYIEGSPIVTQGIIQRIDWMYDLIEDVRKGVIHIPYEICEQARMNKEDTRKEIINWECFFRNPVFRSWFNHELLQLESGWKKYLEEQPIWNYFYGPIGGRIVFFVIRRQFGPQLKWLREMGDEYNKERSRNDYQVAASC
jgi:hypothetical protein